MGLSFGAGISTKMVSITINKKGDFIMKVKDIKSITDERYEIVIFVPSEKFNSDKQDSYTQSKKYTVTYNQRFYPKGPQMETSELEIHLIEPDIYEYDIPALNIYTK